MALGSNAAATAAIRLVLGPNDSTLHGRLYPPRHSRDLARLNAKRPVAHGRNQQREQPVAFRDLRFTEVERIHRNHPPAFLLDQPANLRRERGSSLVADQQSDIPVRGIAHLDRGQRPVVVEPQTPLAESNALYLLVEARIGRTDLIRTGFDHIRKFRDSRLARQAFTQLQGEFVEIQVVGG